MNDALAVSIDAYTKANGGNLPTSWEDLDGYLDYDSIERTVNRKMRPAFHIYGSTRPKYADRRGGQIEIIATTTFVMDDDRRPEKGRLLVVQYANKEIQTEWLTESKLQAAAQAANVPAYSTGDMKIALREQQEQMDRSAREKWMSQNLPAANLAPAANPAPNELNPPSLDPPAPAPSLAIQPSRSFPWEMVAGLATLLAVVAVMVSRRKAHPHA